MRRDIEKAMKEKIWKIKESVIREERKASLLKRKIKTKQDKYEKKKGSREKESRKAHEGETQENKRKVLSEVRGRQGY